jgi:hypothetical protein
VLDLLAKPTIPREDVIIGAVYSGAVGAFMLYGCRLPDQLARRHEPSPPRILSPAS